MSIYQYNVQDMYYRGLNSAKANQLWAQMYLGGFTGKLFNKFIDRVYLVTEYIYSKQLKILS